MSDVHGDDPEDGNSDLDEFDDDGNMRVDEPPQASRQWKRPGLGRGDERTDIFGSNLAGRKTAALSLAAYASSCSHYGERKLQSGNVPKKKRQLEGVQAQHKKDFCRLQLF